MNLQWNIETYITVTAILFSLLGLFLIIRINWKRYGLLFLISGTVGNVLCFIFTNLGFYSFPYRLFPNLSNTPLLILSLVFPFIVLVGVRYSPNLWAWKIPFYWVIVHLVVLAETLALQYTNLIKYDFEWDFWDSYTWWWLFFLFFDLIGSLIIPNSLRKPISKESFSYGKWAFFILHFILITTIFLGGVYLGIKIGNR